MTVRVCPICDIADCATHRPSAQPIDPAAIREAALQARIKELVKERDDLGRKLNTARYGQPDFAWSIHEEAMADLRAKLTKAVEALVQLERIVGDILGAHLQDSESRDKAIDLIKTTLAELEGK